MNIPKLFMTTQQMMCSRMPYVSRGVALFLGAFTLLNMLGGVWVPHFDANCWWIDLRLLPNPLAQMLLIASVLVLLSYGCGVQLRKRGWRIFSIGVMMALIVATGLNAIQYYLMLAQGAVYDGCWVPFSAILCVLCVMIAAMMIGQSPHHTTPHARRLVPVTLLACAVFFPLLQIYCYGMTDYRRPADVIVVLGARAYADGSPSTALADRVRTACMLYHQGYAPLMIVSGGPGDGLVHETEAMRRMAIRLGVPDRAILCDRGGVSTQATVNDTCTIFAKSHMQRILVVSHAFHLPRIKLIYQRAGWNVYTVPVYRQRLHAEVPYLMAREVLGLWIYYLGPLLGGIL